MVSNRKESDAYHAAVDAYVDAVEDAGQGRTIIDENAEVGHDDSLEEWYGHLGYIVLFYQRQLYWPPRARCEFESSQLFLT